MNHLGIFGREQVQRENAIVLEETGTPEKNRRTKVEFTHNQSVDKVGVHGRNEDQDHKQHHADETVAGEDVHQCFGVIMAKLVKPRN